MRIKLIFWLIVIPLPSMWEMDDLVQSTLGKDFAINNSKMETSDPL